MGFILVIFFVIDFCLYCIILKGHNLYDVDPLEFEAISGSPLVFPRMSHQDLLSFCLLVWFWLFASWNPFFSLPVSAGLIWGEKGTNFMLVYHLIWS